MSLPKPRIKLSGHAGIGVAYTWECWSPWEGTIQLHCLGRSPKMAYLTWRAIIDPPNQ